MIKPFAKTNLSPEKLVCNYRISRSRRTIENTFGLAAAQFRIFRRPIIAKVKTVIEIMKAVVILHNYLMKSPCSTDANSYYPVGFTDRDDTSGLNEGDWRREAESCKGLIPLQCIVSNNYTRNAKETREDYILIHQKVPLHGKMILYQEPSRSF